VLNQNRDLEGFKRSLFKILFRTGGATQQQQKININKFFDDDWNKPQKTNSAICLQKIWYLLNDPGREIKELAVNALLQTYETDFEFISEDI